MSDLERRIIVIVLCIGAANFVGYFFEKKAKKLFVKAVIYAIATTIGLLLGLVLQHEIDSISPPTEEWGPWSKWDNVVYADSDTREVEQREVIVGYNMVVYVTQENKEPHYRNFRDYSIKDKLEAYGARESYSEKHFELYVSAELLKCSKEYGQGVFIPYIDEEHVEGYNRGNEVAYVIEIPVDSEGRCYPFFVKDTETEIQYRYRDRIN